MTSPSTPPKQPPPAYRSLRTKPSCCACKHQRRRCSPECPLAPYFPPEKSADFRNVHKLFGIHNVVNLLKNVPPSHREDAVKSLCFEAYMRANDPVGGSYTVVFELCKRILQCNSELEAVLKQLSLYKPTYTLYDDLNLGLEKTTLSDDLDKNLDWENMVFNNNFGGEEGSGNSMDD